MKVEEFVNVQLVINNVEQRMVQVIMQLKSKYQMVGQLVIKYQIQMELQMIDK